jgi:hypothetical protein
VGLSEKVKTAVPPRITQAWVKRRMLVTNACLGSQIAVVIWNLVSLWRTLHRLPRASAAVWLIVLTTRRAPVLWLLWIPVAVIAFNTGVAVLTLRTRKGWKAILARVKVRDEIEELDRIAQL